MNICIFGASSDNIPQSYMDAAYDFGVTLAMRGHTLYFGGGAHGVMGAVARGVKSCADRSEARAVGIAPSFFDTGDILFRGCDDFIYTETMRERKAALEDNADAFVILPGGIGTYEEFFEVLVLAQLGQHNKPIAVYDVDGCYDRLNALLRGTVEEGFMELKCLSLCEFCREAADVFDYIENRLNKLNV